MKEFWTKTKEQVVLYKIALGMVVLFSANSLFTCILAALAGGAQWASMTGQQKFLVVVGICANWTGLLLAFFNKAAARIKEGRFPISDGTTFSERNPKL